MRAVEALSRQRREGLPRLIELAAARPRLTLAVVLVLALGGGRSRSACSRAPAPTRSSAARSANYQVTADDQAHFGGDPVIVLIQEPLTDLVLTKELATVTQLEACLAGQTVVANAKLQRVHASAAGSATALRRLRAARAGSSCAPTRCRSSTGRARS